ncbi:uncharacterized protein LOC113296070 [Papaver somniferum]|uniref:uncharacterized protein LOC113296070 n=1 Tax=Papaver somniferum TaxID=3469 RepID=UPI000E6F97A7|nr:uncharacterized protein LOC113296070 [Papaver somniferum]XP_026400193.1 uncharacterized protein LOC113296070 [Papaver somniferum]
MGRVFDRGKESDSIQGFYNHVGESIVDMLGLLFAKLPENEAWNLQGVGTDFLVQLKRGKVFDRGKRTELIMEYSYLAGKYRICDIVASHSFIFLVCLNLMDGYHKMFIHELALDDSLELGYIPPFFLAANEADASTDVASFKFKEIDEAVVIDFDRNNHIDMGEVCFSVPSDYCRVLFDRGKDSQHITRFSFIGDFDYFSTGMNLHSEEVATPAIVDFLKLNQATIGNEIDSDSEYCFNKFEEICKHFCVLEEIFHSLQLITM